MRTLTALLLAGILMTGCKKDDPVGSSNNNTSTGVFTSANVKNAPVYYSFSSKDSVASTGVWDLKLTTLYASDDSTNSYKFPGIVLGAGVTAKIVDGQKFENVDPSAVTGLATDATGFITYTTRSIKSGPFYFSFDTGDTTTSTGNWDVKMTRDAFAFPIIVLNRAKNVQAKVIDTTVSFENLNQFYISGLTTDATDSTFVIGQNCFSYDTTSHLLSPYATRVFVLKTASGNTVKFRTLNYYNSANASGFVKFEYYDKKKENYAIGTNCLSYNGTTHILSPYTDRTFVVKNAAGVLAKFKMLTYYNEANASGFMKLQYEVK